MSGMVRRSDDRDEEHRSWDELAVGWALHALEPEDETVFAAHLAGCRRCAHTVAETAEVMAAMAGDLPQAEPPEGLRERLRAAVEKTEQQIAPARPAAQHADPLPAAPPLPGRSRGPAPGPLRGPLPGPLSDPLPGPLPGPDLGDLRAPVPTRAADPRPAWRRGLPTALVAAAVAAVLALGAWNVAVIGDRNAARATAAEQARMLDELLAPGRATIAPLTEDGRAVATVVARDDQVQVVANGLSVNDDHDTTYVVWGMHDGNPKPLGTFDVVTPQMDLRTVGSAATGLDQYSEYAVSIEPGRQAPSSPTDVVATGQVTS
jgi:anti-sigma factor RsiW